MAWIESHQELRDNPKTRKLSRSLNISIPAVIGHLQCLWWWAIDYAQDGELSKYDNEDIADAMMWEGCPEELVEALIKVRFIDEDEDGRRIHDWREYAGKLVERREKDRERKRNTAAPRTTSEAVQKYSNGIPTEIPRNDNGTRADSVVTEQNLTEPNSTVPNSTEQESTAAASGGEEEVNQSERVPFVKIRELYNSTCTRLSKIKTIEGERRKAVSARYKTYGMDGFQQLFDKAASSNFLCGESPSNWTADFDWLVNTTNFAKVIEGKYDKGKYDNKYIPPGNHVTFNDL